MPAGFLTGNFLYILIRMKTQSIQQVSQAVELQAHQRMACFRS